MSTSQRHLPALTKSRQMALAVAVPILTGAIVAAVLLRGPDEQRPAPPASASTATPEKRTPSAATPEKTNGPLAAPDRLVASAIDLDAQIVDVGTTQSNAQEVPQSLDVTGWWKDGQQPGDEGNAVIVGHTASQGDGVFDNLDDLKDGDTLRVRAGTASRTFTVTDTNEVDVARFDTVADDIYRANGPSGLVLMTCGDWNGQEFTSTIIVHATAAGGENAS